jgi:hypothetical protein
MVSIVLAVILALGAPLSHGTPNRVAATDAPRVYRTYIQGRYESFGYAGTLKLTFSNGYVNGTYVPDTGGIAPESISGGYNGAKVWIDFRSYNRLHIEGTIGSNGDIKGYGAPLQGANPKQYIFTGKLQHTPA